MVRAKDFENVGHGVFRKSLHGMQGSPEKRSFEISELTPPPSVPRGLFQKGKPDLQGCSPLGKQGRSLLFTAESLFEVLLSKKSRMETGLVFLPFGHKSRSLYSGF